MISTNSEESNNKLSNNSEKGYHWSIQIYHYTATNSNNK